MKAIFGTSPRENPAAKVDETTFIELVRGAYSGELRIEMHRTKDESITFDDLSEKDTQHIGKLKSGEEFPEYASRLADHLSSSIYLNRQTGPVKTYTPWGRSVSATKYGLGVVFYETPSHGGFKLSVGKNELVPEPLRNENRFYEEDVEWAKVAIAFPDLFTEYELTTARRTLIDFCPDEYEAVTGEEILPGQSVKRDEQAFKAENANKWVVISALTSKAHDGMVECIATKGGERSGHFNGRYVDIEEMKFLVPSGEYKPRGFQGSFGFVIDPDRHPACEETTFTY